VLIDRPFGNAENGSLACHRLKLLENGVAIPKSA
jgi:hypothetical protein